MLRTRSVKIGKCTVKITDVPDDVSDDELYSYVLMKLWQMNREKAIREMAGLGKAS